MIDEYQQFLREHLPYEINMLEWAYVVLHDDKFKEKRRNELLRNLLIECFWLHARNLIEFFANPTRNGSSTGAASALDFIEGKHPITTGLAARMTTINTQVSHLQYGRPLVLGEKLNSDEMHPVYGAVLNAVAQFEERLTVEAREHWASRTKIKIEVTEATRTACTTITTVTSAFNDFGKGSVLYTFLE